MDDAIVFALQRVGEGWDSDAVNFRRALADKGYVVISYAELTAITRTRDEVMAGNADLNDRLAKIRRAASQP